VSGDFKGRVKVSITENNYYNMGVTLIRGCRALCTAVNGLVAVLYHSSLRQMTTRCGMVCVGGSEVSKHKERLLKGQCQSNITKRRMKGSPAQQKPGQVLHTVFDFQLKSSGFADEDLSRNDLRGIIKQKRQGMWKSSYRELYKRTEG
jgi:hypothetical protein